MNILDFLPPLLVYLHGVESEYFECGGGGNGHGSRGIVSG